MKLIKFERRIEEDESKIELKQIIDAVFFKVDDWTFAAFDVNRILSVDEKGLNERGFKLRILKWQKNQH